MHCVQVFHARNHAATQNHNGANFFFLWNDLIFTHMQTHQTFLILGRSKIFEDFDKMSDEK